MCDDYDGDGDVDDEVEDGDGDEKGGERNNVAFFLGGRLILLLLQL